MSILKMLTVLALTLCISVASFADEGMWLPLYIKQLNEKKMQEMGMKISADDIYSINNASLKDAVVSLGGFCTAEIVSDKGLLFTNHHCAYEKIANHSTEENDYLANGFWAKSFDQEKPNPGLFVKRLVRMEDVTEIMMGGTAGIDNPMMAAQREQQLMDSLTSAAVEGTHYDADVKSYFYGNEYYLLVYETFTDVRLVGAPPSMIGKYGKDTDNWMWPRHTGDFAILRIYTGPDGKPADYSEDNIPYKPKKHFKVSLKGYQEGDFAAIMGFPGNTERYLTSADLDYKLNTEQPYLIELFETMLGNMKEKMDADRKAAIEMASGYASLSNYYKYLKGQNRGLKTYGVIAEKKEQEKEFMEWVNKDPARKEEYGSIVSDVKSAYEKLNAVVPGFYHLGYGMFRLDLMGHASTMMRLKSSIEQEAPEEDIDKSVENAKAVAEEYFNGYTGVQQKNFKDIMMLLYKHTTPEQRPEFFKEIEDDAKGDKAEAVRNYIDEAMAESLILNQEELNDWFEKRKMKDLEKDNFLMMVEELIGFFRNNYIVNYQGANGLLSDAMSRYVKGLREYQPDKVFYPDANSTLRLSYGSIEPYMPRDAVFYNYYTTHHGILAKNVDGDDEFDAPEKLEKMLKEEKFGKYGVNDTLKICFLTNNDITGGNSGSPVFNGEGHIIGIAFDGNWESMTGDLLVDPKLNRTISVDIRYVLYVMDKYAGAGNLVSELDLVE